MNNPVPHHLRSPRRAYDRDGLEISPATVGGIAAVGLRSIQIFCNACGHQVIVGLDGLPNVLAIPDVPIVLKLRCRCGSTNVGVMIDVSAHCARVRETMGQELGSFPASYHVVPWQEIVGKKREERLVAALEAERKAK